MALLSVRAQPNYPMPTGVWCSCPPSNGSGSNSVDPAVAAKPYVKGILFRASWKDIETADNTYNWSIIDNQLASAQSFGKKISFAIGGGPNSPSWLFAQGAQSISYSVPFSGTIPIPWDPVFLAKWKEFITALGSRYANNTTIQLVYMTNSSQNGFEMQLPFNPTPSYATIGYTDQRMIDSWQQIIDTYKTAFPNHYLTNDFHPINSSNTVADSIYAYAKQSVETRYGAAGWWWTQNNTTVYPSQYTILQNSTSNNLFTGIQMAYSGLNSASSFGPGGMPAALDLAIQNNIKYWEIWNVDITSGSFDTLLNSVSTTPTPTPTPSPTPTPTPTTFTVSGRVLTPSGIGIRNVQVSLFDPQNVQRIAVTSSLGTYSFDQLQPGAQYTLTVTSKRYRFAPLVVQMSSNLSNVDLIGLQ
ncbi:MAG: carboxypeptidase-like regulatory domain-containing protein [Pyrinomonadaceae bacterium]